MAPVTRAGSERADSQRVAEANGNAKENNLKRGREPSLEPSTSETPSSSSKTTLKKNRLDSTAEVDGDVDTADILSGATATSVPIATSTSADSATTETPAGSRSASTSGQGKAKGKEGKVVKEVRRKVEKMSYEEGEGKGEGQGGAASKEEGEESEPSGSSRESGAAPGEIVTSTSGAAGTKRKALDRTASATNDLEEGTKRVKDSPSPPDATTASAKEPIPAPVPPKKTQTTFASFSSAASPFARATSSAKPSGLFGDKTSDAVSAAPPTAPFAASESAGEKIDRTASLDATKHVPKTTSADDTVSSHTETSAPVASASSSTAAAESTAKPSAPSTSSATPSAIPSKSAFGGFGGYASKSGFAGLKGNAFASSSSSPSSSAFGTLSTKNNASLTSTSAFSSTPAASFVKSKALAEEDAGAGTRESGGDGKESEKFEVMLSGGGETVAEEGRVALEAQDVTTGEEDEETKYSLRTKLYYMEPDGGWRERGVGLLKLNVRKGDGKGARLVMRADGVLRLILNVSLYTGMNCLEDGKHVRLTVFEDGQRRLITLRTNRPETARELAKAILTHVPSGPADKQEV